MKFERLRTARTKFNTMTENKLANKQKEVLWKKQLQHRRKGIIILISKDRDYSRYNARYNKPDS